MPRGGEGVSSVAKQLSSCLCSSWGQDLYAHVNRSLGFHSMPFSLGAHECFPDSQIRGTFIGKPWWAWTYLGGFWSKVWCVPYSHWVPWIEEEVVIMADICSHGWGLSDIDKRSLFPREDLPGGLFIQSRVLAGLVYPNVEIRHCPHSFVCLHTCVHVCVHGHMCALCGTCVHVCIFVRSHVYICVHVYVHACMHTHVHVVMNMCVHVCFMCTRVCLCICGDICACMHVHRDQRRAFGVLLCHSAVFSYWTQSSCLFVFPLAELANSKSQWFSSLCLLNVWTAGNVGTHPAYYIDIGIWSLVLTGAASVLSL